MAEFNTLSMIEMPKEGILSKKIFVNDKCQISVFAMPKNEAISEHTSTKAGIVQVITGKGKFILSGKEIEMIKGKIIYMKENEVHTIESDEDLVFTLTLIN